MNIDKIKYKIGQKYKSHIYENMSFVIVEIVNNRKDIIYFHYDIYSSGENICNLKKSRLSTFVKRLKRNNMYLET